MASSASHIVYSGKSHVRGPTVPALLSHTVGSLFDRTVDTYPTRDALIVCDQGIRWTYEQLREKADAAACGLAALGLEKGDRLGVWMPNNAEWVVMQFATAKLGVILVNINPAYRVNELEYALNQVGVKALVMVREFVTSNYVDMMTKLCPELITCKPNELSSPRIPTLRLIVQVGSSVSLSGVLPFDTLYSMSTRLPHVPMSDDEPINIQFTSGTTGKPKAALLTHRGIVNNGYFVGSVMKYSPIDRVCIAVPLYHCFGMVLGNMNVVAHGACMIYPSGKFDPEKTLDCIERETCTAIYGVPTMFISMLDHTKFSATDFSSLRTGICAGSIKWHQENASIDCFFGRGRGRSHKTRLKKFGKKAPENVVKKIVPVDVMNRIIRDMNVAEITCCYGMTETSPVSWQSHTDDPVTKRCETVGRIHPHVECKVVDDTGATVDVGQLGELMTKGYALMKEYWGDEEATQEVMKDGWMYTGDLVQIDEDGYCRIAGRKKDVIIRGGENISPRDIEDELFTHPHVLNASVVGVPCVKYGEQVCAWIQWKGAHDNAAAADELRDFLTQRMAKYKVPKYFMFKDEFPMTITGKIQKFKMRNISLQELNLRRSFSTTMRATRSMLPVGLRVRQLPLRWLPK